MALGLNVAARNLFELGLELHREVDGPGHAHTADAMSALAWSYQEESLFLEADSLYREVLKIREALGADSLELAEAWGGLARALRDQGEADSAKILATRALELHRDRLGPDHIRTVDLIGMVAFMQRAAGEMDSAEALSREALEKYIAMGDNGARGAARTLNNLAFLLRTKGELPEAEKTVPHRPGQLCTLAHPTGNPNPVWQPRQRSLGPGEAARSLRGPL